MPKREDFPEYHKRLEVVDPRKHYSLADLIELWDLKRRHQGAYDARIQLRHFLQDKVLHVVQASPYLYSVQPPLEQPELTDQIQQRYEQLKQPMMYRDIVSLWQVSTTVAKWELLHLMNMGYVSRNRRGLYISIQASGQPLPPLSTHARQNTQLLEARLSQVTWPARLSEIACSWNISSVAANAYLYRLLKKGQIIRKDGVYSLPDHSPQALVVVSQ